MSDKLSKTIGIGAQSYGKFNESCYAHIADKMRNRTMVTLSIRAIVGMINYF